MNMLWIVHSVYDTDARAETSGWAEAVRVLVPLRGQAPLGGLALAMFATFLLAHVLCPCVFPSGSRAFCLPVVIRVFLHFLHVSACLLHDSACFCMFLHVSFSRAVVFGPGPGADVRTQDPKYS